MKELFEYLGNIEKLLEQIYTITDNQTTVLLAKMDTEEAENGALDMIAQMADYKDELMHQLGRSEKMFQEEYDVCKNLLKEEKDILELQRLVAAVLDAKQAVVEREQSNLLLMQAASKKKLERVYVPQNATEVSNAYKKQQKRT